MASPFGLNGQSIGLDGQSLGLMASSFLDSCPFAWTDGQPLGLMASPIWTTWPAHWTNGQPTWTHGQPTWTHGQPTWTHGQSFGLRASPGADEQSDCFLLFSCSVLLYFLFSLIGQPLSGLMATPLDFCPAARTNGQPLGLMASSLGEKPAHWTNGQPWN